MVRPCPKNSASDRRPQQRPYVFKDHLFKVDLLFIVLKRFCLVSKSPSNKRTGCASLPNPAREVRWLTCPRERAEHAEHPDVYSVQVFRSISMHLAYHPDHIDGSNTHIRRIETPMATRCGWYTGLLGVKRSTSGHRSGGGSIIAASFLHTSACAHVWPPKGVAIWRAIENNDQASVRSPISQRMLFSVP